MGMMLGCWHFVSAFGEHWELMMQMEISTETAGWAVKGLRRLNYISEVDGAADWALMLRASEVEAGEADEAGASGEADETGAVDVNANANVWVVNLHGHGSAGDQLFTRQDIRTNWLPCFVDEGYSIVTPNLRGNAWMSPAAVADLHGLLSYLREHEGAERFVLVSGSMGGTGSLIYATQRPLDIAGVVALCPATDLPGYLAWTTGELERPVIKQIHDAIEASYGHDAQMIAAHSVLGQVDQLTMPVCVIHGDDDAAIPVEQARQLAKAMAGHEAFSYRELAGGNHDAPLWEMATALAWVRERI